MIRFIAFFFLLVIFHNARADAPDYLMDETYIASSTCRGGSMFWHIAAVDIINGSSKDQFMNRMEGSIEEKEKITPLIDSFFSIPKENLLRYLVIQHGKCIEASLNIPHEKAANCYETYLQPAYVNLYGPNQAAKPSIDFMVKAEGGYLKCLKSNVLP